MVEGSNPGRSILFRVEKFKKNGTIGQEWRMRSSFVSTAHARNLDFRFKREFDFLGGHAHAREHTYLVLRMRKKACVRIRMSRTSRVLFQRKYSVD